MMKRLDLLIIVLLSLWLPVQGYGAIAMPFCAHGAGNADAADAGPEGDHAGHGGHAMHAGHDAHAGHEITPGDAPPAGHRGDGEAASSEGPNLACNDCGACQLACSPILFAPAPALFAAGAVVFDLRTVVPLLSFTPERLQRPPLSALA